MFGPDDFEVQIQQENPPGIHAEPSIPPAQDEEYGDFIVKHGQNMGGKFLPVNELFGILYIPLNEIGPLEITAARKKAGNMTEIRFARCRGHSNVLQCGGRRSRCRRILSCIDGSSGLASAVAT